MPVASKALRIAHLEYRMLAWPVSVLLPTTTLSCTMVDPLDFKFVNNLRPPCSRCGRPLILTRIEPDEVGFDLRTYYCAACEATEAVIAPV